MADGRVRGLVRPRGLASIVFAILLVEESGELPHEGVLLATIFVTVGLSVLLHGLTAAPLARRYAGGSRRTRAARAWASSRVT